MRKFRNIIEDTTPPSTQDLWINNGRLKFFGPNGWTDLLGGENSSLNEVSKLSDNETVNSNAEVDSIEALDWNTIVEDTEEASIDDSEISDSTTNKDEE